jgi:Domain of unknown function (DUF1905)
MGAMPDHRADPDLFDATPLLRIAFAAEVIEWRGPSPFFFAAIPPDHFADVREAARSVSYGWGMVPVRVTIGGFAFTTALFPRDDGYLLPLKDAVRRRAEVVLGDPADIELEIHADRDRLP